MEELANRINEEIKNSTLYKNYLSLKEKVENDSYLKVMKNELELLKNEICKSKNKDLLDEYYDKEKEYLNNSFVKEYLDIKAQLKELFKEIVDILSLN
jgi:hypothetical protein